MNRPISLNDTLKAWKVFKNSIKKFGEHLTDKEISILLSDETVTNREELINHLMLCNECALRLDSFEEVRKTSENWETAWPIAAATEKRSWPITIYSAQKTYKIRIRQSSKDPQKGYIKVSIYKKNMSLFEGKKIAVIDGRAQELLRGVIKNREVIGRIPDLDAIDLHLLVKVIK